MDPDQIDNAAGQGTDAGAATQPPGERTFSQEEVNRISAKARQEGRDSAAKKPAPTQPAPRTESTASTDTQQLQAELADLKLQRSFDRQAAKLGVPEEAIDDLFDLFKAQRPAEPAAWFAAKATKFGFAGATTTVPTTTDSEPARPAPSAPSAPARVDTPTAGGLVNIYGGITPEQFAGMSPQQLREHHERNVAAAQRRAGAPPVPQHKR